MARAIHSFLSIGLLAIAAGGCVTNPITGRRQAMMVSDSSAAQQSSQAYSQLLSQAHQKGALDVDPAATARVQAIARPLITEAVKLRPESANWKWDVHVLKSGEVNAWCMAGGKMAVYTGLLQTVRPTDDELAQVMGHEIAHALLSHQAEKMSRAQMQQVGLGLGVLAGAVAGYDVRGVAGLANQMATLGLQLPNSREAESEADSVGIEMAAKAGFDPKAAVTLWNKMLQAGGSGTPEWLSTHPDPRSRIAAMQAKAHQLEPVYEANKNKRAQ